MKLTFSIIKHYVRICKKKTDFDFYMFFNFQQAIFPAELLDHLRQEKLKNIHFVSFCNISVEGKETAGKNFFGI